MRNGSTNLRDMRLYAFSVPLKQSEQLSFFISWHLSYLLYALVLLFNKNIFK